MSTAEAAIGGRTVVVTGAASGSGAELAATARAAGWRLRCPPPQLHAAQLSPDAAE